MAGCILVLLRGLSLCVLLLDVHADLIVGGKKCGEINCSKIQFCSPIHSQCELCSDICDPRRNNFQADICQKQCQEYVHDQLYVKRDEQHNNDLGGVIRQLTTMAAASLVVSCLLLVIVVCLLLYLFLKQKRMKGSFFKNFSKENGKVAVKNNNVDVENPKILYKGDGLKLDMPSAQTQISNAPSMSPTQDPVTPATTSTPLSRPRHPSEDTTLEYAYDNPALTPSPVFNKDEPDIPARRESSF